MLLFAQPKARFTLRIRLNWQPLNWSFRWRIVFVGSWDRWVRTCVQCFCRIYLRFEHFPFINKMPVLCWDIICMIHFKFFNIETTFKFFQAENINYNFFLLTKIFIFIFFNDIITKLITALQHTLSIRPIFIATLYTHLSVTKENAQQSLYKNKSCNLYNPCYKTLLVKITWNTIIYLNLIS